MDVVKTKALYKRFGDTVVVNDVYLRIQEGEIFGLLGPNGAGKSTIINMLNGLLPIDSGEIELFGKNMNQENSSSKKEKEFIRKNIGVVPQDLAIYEELSAYENVHFFAGLYGLKGSELKKSVEEALEFVGLSAMAKKLPKTFSGGMKRRLNIACAIAHRPKLIIMDEPTVGIDPQSRNHILQSVKELNKKGSTIIYTSHYMEEVDELCTRLAIMDYGKIIIQGTKEDLKESINNINSHQLQDPLMELGQISLETVFLTITGRNLRD